MRGSGKKGRCLCSGQLLHVSAVALWHGLHTNDEGVDLGGEVVRHGGSGPASNIATEGQTWGGIAMWLVEDFVRYLTRRAAGPGGGGWTE